MLQHINLIFFYKLQLLYTFFSITVRKKIIIFCCKFTGKKKNHNQHAINYAFVSLASEEVYTIINCNIKLETYFLKSPGVLQYTIAIERGNPWMTQGCSRRHPSRLWDALGSRLSGHKISLSPEAEKCKFRRVACMINILLKSMNSRCKVSIFIIDDLTPY